MLHFVTVTDDRFFWFMISYLHYVNHMVRIVRYVCTKYMYIHVNIIIYTHAYTHTVAEQAIVELSAVLMEVAVIIKDTSRYNVP